MKVGILTGGGDCPGLNSAIRGIVFRLAKDGHETVAFLDGWAGLVESRSRKISVSDVAGIASEGGTIIGTSRTNPFKNEERDVPLVLKSLKQVDALIAIGGEDTLGVAEKLHSKHSVKVVGVPKTMDNDLNATDYTFGFDTAVQNSVEAIDRLHSTAKSHKRVIVVELFGRHAGWVSLYAGLAGSAHAIVIPEFPVSIDAVCAKITAREKAGKHYSIVVVSEGAEFPELKSASKTDSFGHKTLKDAGVGDFLAKEIERRTGKETRSVVLGHTVRGGSPTAFDRVLSARVGVKAAEMVLNKEFGKMASIRGTEVASVPLSEAVGKLKTVPKPLFQLSEIFE